MNRPSITLLLLISLTVTALSFGQSAMSTPRKGGLFDQLDRDHNGKLTLDEFPDPEVFEQVDADGDGVVTWEEARDYWIAKARQRMTAPAGRDASTSGIRQKLNVRYGQMPGVDPNLLSLDVYSPGTPGKHPVMVMIHGGGWRNGDKAHAGVGIEKARFFVPLGCVYVSINYRLSPAVMHPEHVKDVAKALAWVNKHISEYEGDNSRVYLMGHSAGAHLAALVATDESRLAAEGASPKMLSGVILLDGAGYNIPGGAREPVVQPMYASAFGPDPKVQKDASPITHIAAGKGIPPFLILHTGRRQASGLASEELGAALRKAGISAKVVSVPAKSHAEMNQDVGKPGDLLTTSILEFLKLQRKDR